MLRACVLDFGGSWEEHLPVVEFTYNNKFQSNIQMAPFEALYGRPCRSPSCWLEAGESLLLGPDLIKETSKKIELARERMRAAKDCQKSYADSRRRPLEFAVAELVFLRVSPMRGVTRFGFRGKLSPMFVGPYPVIARVGPSVYRLQLPASMSTVHPMFHVSMMRKCLRHLHQVFAPSELEVIADLTYPDRHLKIVDTEVKRTQRTEIRMVKV